jgi:ectoine hydroxylase-related dioxygenase (phytanoyl-CoA dioxygenase family)
MAAAVPAPVLACLEEALSTLPTDQPGVRLYGVEALRPQLQPSGVVGKVAASVLGGECRPVRAVLFNKTAAANWSLAWHQDRTIAVVERVETPGYEVWSVKAGVRHVEPPFAVIEGMITLRVHLDRVDEDNAPLLISPGSHRFGRIPEAEIADVVRRCGTAGCLAEAGDVWLYATPILHASAASARPARRRVLQVDYAHAPLPGGLEWFGV